jgi:F420-dependent oxidoreductase-like protein
LKHRGEHYQIPIQGGTGLGKPLKIFTRPLRSHIPIYIAAIGPKNVALTAEIADGWLPVFFSPDRMDLFREQLEKGFGRAVDTFAAEFDIAPTVQVALGDDVAACRAAVKPTVALYVGGMGSRDRNFYNSLACRYGYEEAALKIQEHFLEGRRAEAVRAVPDELVDEVALCGPKERIAERLSRWRESGVGTLICGIRDPRVLRTMAEIVL